jgi:hypothetical protein
MRNGLSAPVMRRVAAAVLTVTLCGGFYAQLSARQPVPPIRLVDMHTAGVVPKGDFLFETRMYENGRTGFLFSIAAGITDRFCFGLGYGAEGIIGRSNAVRYNPFPECLVKFRVIEENYVLPGIAAGFDYQGFGGISDFDRFGYYGYTYKSQGFFIAVSKSYLFARFLDIGFHGDVNFSLEEIARVKWPNLGVGIDMGVSDKFSFVAEYDFGLNTRDPYGSNDSYTVPLEGYLNAGLRIHFTPEFSLEIDARDILQKRTFFDSLGIERRVGWSREIKVTFISPIQG